MEKFRTHSTFLVVMALLVLVVGVSIVSAASNKQRVKADTLTGYQETPSVSSPGTGSFTADIDEGVITYVLTYSGLSAPAFVSHIHFGNRFVAGNVSVFLCGGGGKPACPPGTVTEATVTGTIIPADVIGPAAQGIAPGDFDELVRAIRAGVTYVNVHTPLPFFPGGEIRGQINDEDQRQP